MAERKPMRIALETSGGFSGRGVGSIVINGHSAVADGQHMTELTADELARIDRLPILRRAARPPLIRPDAIVYTLTVDGQRWVFGEGSAPPDFTNWANALLAIRDRVVGGGQAPSSM
jgi:hypothetical protein